MKLSQVLCLVIICGGLNADSLLDPQVLSKQGSSPSSQFKKAKRERPTYDYRVHDTIMVNVSVDDTIEFSKKQDYKRDNSWGTEFKSFIDNFGGAAKPSLPKVELESQSEVKANGKKTDGSKVRLNVPCEIIEILPQGDLVIEGARTISSDSTLATVRIGVVSIQNTSIKLRMWWIRKAFWICKLKLILKALWQIIRSVDSLGNC